LDSEGKKSRKSKKITESTELTTARTRELIFLITAKIFTALIIITTHR
jgi:hypothetical protein